MSSRVQIPPPASPPREPRAVNWQRVAKRVRVPMGAVFTTAFLVFARPTWGSLLASVPFVAVGLAIRACAAGYLRKKTELATTGPYAHTRNPLYLGSTLIAVGFGVAGTNGVVAAAFAAAFLAIYYPTILNEEAYLRGRHAGFDDYARAVPRLLPRLTPARLGESGGGFSLAQYLHNREQQALWGALGCYAVLIARMWLAHR